MHASGPTPRVLAIAGSDSGGGAGIQADLKALARCGVHGMTAITAITAQNTREVSAVAAVAPEMIVAQVRAVADDIGVDAVKVGMLGDDAADLARAVHRLGPDAVVVTGGHREEATDVFFDGTRLEAIPGQRFPDGASHGSGCTHSSALAAHLALGCSPLQAARHAREIAGEAVRRGRRDLGAGPGPVDAVGIDPVRAAGTARPVS